MRSVLKKWKEDGYLSNKKFKRISIILWGYLILAVVLDQFMKLQLPTLLLLPAICIPAGYILFHVTLIEYCRGNVEWSNYIWGALLSLCLFGGKLQEIKMLSLPQSYENLRSVGGLGGTFS